MDEHLIPVSPRRRVDSLRAGLIPIKFIETLEHDQKLAHCCRHPEDHEIEALKTKKELVRPDVYIFHCTCGRKHRRFMCGDDSKTPENRPVW